MTSGSLQRSAKEVASAHPEVDFALVLARTIDALQSDPEQLRSAVYDLARHKLEQLAHDDPSEKQRLMQALEVAIAGVEEHTRNNPIRAGGLPPPERPIGPLRNEALLGHVGLDAIPLEPVRPGSSNEPASVSQLGRSRWSSGAPLRYLAMLIFFAGIAGLIVMQRRGWSPPSADRLVAKIWRSDLSATRPKPEASPTPAAAVLTKAPEPKVDPLVPTAYGVYAVSENRLYELQALQGRVPDPRVAISAAITKASETALPDGRVRFVVFRRETPTSDASDPIELRVVAQVKQATDFDASGKPVVSSERSWVIRNISLPYRAAPFKDQPGMYQILPRDPDLPLPPGRYVLALNGSGFDFTVDGKITDKRQCLERISAANGVFYSECPNP